MESSQIKKLFTTHDVAKLLGVTPITVIRWIESGKLKCYTTVGGHRRIEHDELAHFAQAYNLPWQGEDELKKRKGYVVMAVDDEPDALEMARDMLGSRLDIKLIEVGNGFSAGAKLVEDRPDLILLDFLMPELDGFEFCRFVRQDPRFKNVPIIAVSGLKTEADMAKMRQAGANDILSKPYSEEMLLAKIEKYLAPKEGGSAPPQALSA